MLYTPAFLAFLTQFLRGTMRGATNPVSLLAALEGSSLPGTAAATSAMVAEIAAQLLASGAVRGMMRASRLTFVPDVFSHARLTGVKEFYARNGYVPSSMAEKAGPDTSGSIGDWFGRQLPGGTMLDTVFASPSILAEVCCSSILALEIASFVLESQHRVQH